MQICLGSSYCWSWYIQSVRWYYHRSGQNCNSIIGRCCHSILCAFPKNCNSISGNNLNGWCYAVSFTVTSATVLPVRSVIYWNFHCATQFLRWQHEERAICEVISQKTGPFMTSGLIWRCQGFIQHCIVWH